MIKNKRDLLEKTFQTFMEIGLGQDRLDLLDDIVAKDVVGFGTAVDEKLFGLNDLKALLFRQKEQSAGMEVTWKLNMLDLHIAHDENTAIYTNDIIVKLTMDGNPVEMYLRFSVVIEYIQDSWKIVHWHGSKPEYVESEKDTWGIQTWKEKAEELEKQVAERTAELLGKNRELEIEAALERVRSVATGMRKQDDLMDICPVIYNELQVLGVGEIRNAMINVYDEDTPYFLNYDYTPASGKNVTAIPYNLHPLIEKQVLETKNIEDAFNEFSFSGKDLIEFRALRKQNGELDDPKLDKTSSLHYYFYSIGSGSIGISSYQSITAEKLELLKRFRNVFTFAYRRYMDVSQAEAQAREAQVQLALERVRARTMAMRNSSELGNLIYHLYGELTKLDAKLDRCFIMIVNPENLGITWWLAGKEGLLAENGFVIPNNPHPSHQLYLRHWSDREKKWTYLFEGKEKADWDHFGFTETDLTKLPEFIKNDMAAVKKIHLSGSSDRFGLLVTGSIESLRDEHQDILSRFTTVFNQTYTRFLDLQKAEAQAKEAKIETALERVRAVVMAMKKSKELVSVSEVVFTELTSLGFSNIRNTQITIENEDKQDFIFYTYSDDKKQDIRTAPYNSWSYLTEAKQQLHEKGAFYEEEYSGEKLKEWRNWVRKTDAPLTERELTSQSLHWYLFAFGKGHMGISSFNAISGEQIETIKRFKNVFELSYRRFDDLQKSEAHALQADQDLIAIKEAKQKAEAALLELKATQAQLVQQEKLASLGQLTAGIAHEIKNPLNFVNNFSEVSIELIAEAKDEISKIGHDIHTQETIEILHDIYANLLKIHEHGTRANNIVNSMLQHSRGGTGKKEASDLNAMVKEYVNLCFHGMRAGKNPINVSIDLDLDQDIKEVSLFREDFSRVIINLCNNAFDAMRTKAITSSDKHYFPSLKIITKLAEKNIILSVADNGAGIPDGLKDKVLLPFFTTKKGTDGTGLGLSISHDIVKAHGGTLQVSSQEGVGTEFSLSLPAV